VLETVKQGIVIAATHHQETRKLDLTGGRNARNQNTDGLFNPWGVFIRVIEREQ